MPCPPQARGLLPPGGFPAVCARLNWPRYREGSEPRSHCDPHGHERLMQESPREEGACLHLCLLFKNRFCFLGSSLWFTVRASGEYEVPMRPTSPHLPEPPAFLSLALRDGSMLWTWLVCILFPHLSVTLAVARVIASGAHHRGQVLAPCSDHPALPPS